MAQQLAGRFIIDRRFRIHGATNRDRVIVDRRVLEVQPATQSVVHHSDGSRWCTSRGAINGWRTPHNPWRNPRMEQPMSRSVDGADS
eukprot:9155497-Pyramimonas_sp.AAC.1